MNQKIKINVYEFTPDFGDKTFIFSQPTDDLGFSYYIVKKDNENKPFIEKIGNPILNINLSHISKIERGTEQYNRFINIYANIQKREKDKRRNNYLSNHPNTKPTITPRHIPRRF